MLHARRMIYVLCIEWSIRENRIGPRFAHEAMRASLPETV